LFIFVVLKVENFSPHFNTRIWFLSSLYEQIEIQYFFYWITKSERNMKLWNHIWMCLLHVFCW
jgi:hypothetical protein